MKMCRHKITPRMNVVLYGIASLAMIMMLGFMIWANIEAKRSHDRIMEMSEKKLQEISRKEMIRDGY